MRVVTALPQLIFFSSPSARLLFGFHWSFCGIVVSNSITNIIVANHGYKGIYHDNYYAVCCRFIMIFESKLGGDGLGPLPEGKRRLGASAVAAAVR